MPASSPSGFADFESGSYLERLDIPIISIISLYGQSAEDWRSSDAGLSMFEATFQVVVPELLIVRPMRLGSPA